MCLDFYAVNLEIVVRVYVCVKRLIPTCKMLIRKNVYSFLRCIARSGNAMFQNKVTELNITNILS